MNVEQLLMMLCCDSRARGHTCTELKLVSEACRESKHPDKKIVSLPRSLSNYYMILIGKQSGLIKVMIF